MDFLDQINNDSDTLKRVVTMLTVNAYDRLDSRQLSAVSLLSGMQALSCCGCGTQEQKDEI